MALFTAEELEAIRMADEDIDREVSAENREREAKWRKSYYQRNREKILARQRKWQAEHRDEINERKRLMRQANKEELREKARAYYQANKERIKQRSRAYHKEHRDERLASMRDRSRRLKEAKKCILESAPTAEQA